ncbi:hypothetical protein [Paenibacillus taiwanensis]|nr:hypothetical protein [Paenibacillus taiwanensis]
MEATTPTFVDSERNVYTNEGRAYEKRSIETGLRCAAYAAADER